MPLYTAKYNLPYPVSSDSPDVPRDMYNLAVALETALDTSLPVGTIVAYGGSAAPAGWHLCNGTQHDSTALATVIGSNYTPNLSDRFLVGTGTTYPTVGLTGGLNTVKLSAAEAGAGAHNHTISVNIGVNSHTHDIAGFTVTSGNDNQDHGHIVDPPPTGTYGGGGHSHGVIIREGNGDNADGPYLDSKPNNQNGARNVGYTDGGGHEHAVDIPAFWSSGRGNTHNHNVTVPKLTSGPPSSTPTASATSGASNPAEASVAHENRPPYFSVTYIIKK